MTNPTSNFGWVMPNPTDLVTDLPADFEVFGQAVDTSMADLKGGTTGQILSKATNTDMDFTWITNDVGDITAVTVTAPITGGGTSGSVGIGISAATTAASGAVQLSDSTSTTSSVLASTPTATKAAYDLAAAAIPKSTVTTAGDVIYATGSSAVTRLGIGTAGQVLKVNSGATAPEWGSGTYTPTTTYLGADVTLAAANTFYDGPNTGTLVNGATYLITAGAMIISPNANEYMTLRLWNGTTTYGEVGIPVNGSFWGGVVTFGCVIPPFIYTAGSTTALKISAATTGAAGTMKLTRNVSANSATSNKVTFITAQRIS
jgi:hypothetical protein